MMSKSVSQAVEFSSWKNGLVDIGGDERTVSAFEELQMLTDGFIDQ